MKVKNNIQVKAEKCVECSTCQLWCSVTYQGNFNLEKARVVLDAPNAITFTDDCIENCSLCAKHCPYGALVAIR